jgi:type II secretory pathway component GspD/PulD (secretin)
MKNQFCQSWFVLTVYFGAKGCDALTQPGAAAGTNAVAPLSLPASVSETNSVSAIQGLVLNFRGAPVDAVLAYLNKEADLTIIRKADTREIGDVDMVSEQPVKMEQIVELLNRVLADHDLTAVQDGKTLAIQSMEDAEMYGDGPVPVWNHDPGSIPQDLHVATWVLPLRSLNAVQVIKDISSLLPHDAVVIANEGANAIIMTAGQADIHHLAQILQALDISNESGLEVFSLAHADATAIAQELKEVFTPQDAGASQGNPFQNFLGNRGGATTTSGGTESSKRAAIHVNAVADVQDNAVLVTAPMDILPGISNLVQKLDSAQNDTVEIRVFALAHADPADVASQIAAIFGDTAAKNNSQSALSGLIPQFVGKRAAAAAGSKPGERMKRQIEVSAVADERTQSVLVTASRETMRQIAGVIADLDSSDKNMEHVYVYVPQHAQDGDLQGPLQALFASTTQTSSSSAVNALTQRANQAAQNGGVLSSSATSGSVGGSSGSGK